MDFNVLGPLVVRDAQVEVRLGGVKRRQLLARLLVDANRPVSVDRLLDDLWDGRIDRAASATLQSHMSQMRKVLGAARIESGPGSYRIVVAPDELDAELFAADLQAARHAAAAGETRDAELRARAALDRWRGEAYGEADGASWAQPEIARLTDMYVEACEIQLEVWTTLGEHARAVGLAQKAVAEHPLRERLWAHLMLALYRDGRQAEALRAYQQLRTTLRDELGIEPSSELRSLEQLVLTQDPTLQGGPRGARPVDRTATTTDPAAPAAPGARVAKERDGERRQLTIAFCDLVDSTALAAALDPEDYRDLVRAYQRAATQVVERRGGIVAHFMGDGLVNYLGFPSAGEDDAARAARGALEIVAAVAAIHTADGQALAARVGIATGVVVIGEMGEGAARLAIDVTGDTPNLAARLQSLAPPGGVVVSDTTRQLLEGWAECESLGATTVRGFREPVVIHRLLSTTGAEARFEAAARRGLQPLVGRDVELDQIADRWRRVENREGAVIVLSGEPGIGKSRLIRAFLDRAAIDARSVVEFRCTSEHSSTPLHPIARFLTRLPRAELAQIAALSRDPDADALLADLAGVEPEPGTQGAVAAPARRLTRTLAMLRSWLTTIGSDGPGVVVFEDVHWADPTTLELLTSLVDDDPIPGLLVVAAARPEFAMSWPPHGHLVHMTLSRLTEAEARALIAHVISTRAVADPIVQQILDRSDRVPLHVEELTRWVLDVEPATADIAVPATLHDSLMARLDALGPARDVAQHASVIGRDVDVGLLAAVMHESPDAARQGLEGLVSAGLLFRRGLDASATYRFRHALLRDAAYASLLRAERRALHLAVATELLASRPDVVEDDPEVLARHFESAEDNDNAVRFWRRAGRRAEQRSAVTEAINAFTRALDLVRSLPESDERDRREMRMLFLLAPIRFRRDGANDEPTAAMAARVRVLSERVGQPFDRINVLNIAWGLAHTRGDLPELVRATEELGITAAGLNDPLLTVLAYQVAASLELYRGDIAAAEAAATAAVEVYQPDFHRAYASVGSNDPGIAAIGELAWCRWNQGLVDTAARLVETALDDLEAPVHPYVVSHAEVNVGVFGWLRRDAETARAASERALAISTENEIEVHSSLARWTLGWAIAALGDPEFGLALTQDGQSRLDRVGFRSHQRGYIIQGEILLALGRYDEALAVLTAGQDVVNETQERREAPDLWRLEAEVHAARRPGDPKALTAAHRALELARSMASAMFELRALTTLVRIAPEASTRSALAAAVDQCTEGLDRADVLDAAAALKPAPATTPRSKSRSKPARPAAPRVRERPRP